MSMMVSFVLSFFPRDVLDEILNLIESVSEDFPSYSFSLVATRLSDCHWSTFRSHEGSSTVTEKDRNKLNYRIGQKQS